MQRKYKVHPAIREKVTSRENCTVIILYQCRSVILTQQHYVLIKNNSYLVRKNMLADRYKLVSRSLLLSINQD